MKSKGCVSQFISQDFVQLFCSREREGEQCDLSFFFWSETDALWQILSKHGRTRTGWLVLSWILFEFLFSTPAFITKNVLGGGFEFVRGNLRKLWYPSESRFSRENVIHFVQCSQFHDSQLRTNKLFLHVCPIPFRKFKPGHKIYLMNVWMMNHSSFWMCNYTKSRVECSYVAGFQVNDRIRFIAESQPKQDSCCSEWW